MTNSWDKCRNCGGERGLHHYQTDQCPFDGREAPIGQQQIWKSTTFELDKTDEVAEFREIVKKTDEHIAELREIVKKTDEHIAELREIVKKTDEHVLELLERLDSLESAAALQESVRIWRRA